MSSNRVSYFKAHKIPGRLNILDLGYKFQFFLSIFNFWVRHLHLNKGFTLLTSNSTIILCGRAEYE